MTVLAQVKARLKHKVKHRTVNHMARRKGKKSKGRKGSFSVGGIKGKADKAANALGWGTLATLIGNKLGVGNPQITSLVGEYYGGGFEGVLYAEGVKLIAGAPSALNNLGGLLGGGGNQMTQGAFA